MKRGLPGPPAKPALGVDDDMPSFAYSLTAAILGHPLWPSLDEKGFLDVIVEVRVYQFFSSIIPYLHNVFFGLIWCVLVVSQEMCATSADITKSYQYLACALSRPSEGRF